MTFLFPFFFIFHPVAEQEVNDMRTGTKAKCCDEDYTISPVTTPFVIESKSVSHVFKPNFCEATFHISQLIESDTLFILARVLFVCLLAKSPLITHDFTVH